MEYYIKTIVVPILSGVIAGIVGYLIGRPKNKAEVNDIKASTVLKEIEALKDIIESWRTHSDRQEVRLEKQERIINEQSEKITLLQSEIEELRLQVDHQCNVCNHKDNGHA